VLVQCNPQVLAIRSDIRDSHIGGPEQRLLYRSADAAIAPPLGASVARRL
jgi:hypothetical protein